MPLLSGDIRFARSAVMADTINGGGPPSAQLLPDGASNAVFPDISEDARTGGLVEIRQVHGVLRNNDTSAALGTSIIIAEPSSDPNVTLTLLKTPTHARRPDIVKLIEATSTPGSELNGFLLENHVASQRSINIGQRPGVAPPSVNTGLVLVLNEGQPSQVMQYVRIRRVTLSEQTFTELVGGQYVDFKLQVATCELFGPLTSDYAGSAPSRFYTRQANKAMVRRVNITDAGTFFGASRLTAGAAALDMELKVGSIYAQIVPNTRTETPLLDQRPGGVQTLALADSYGTLDVSAASHSDRVFVEEFNQGYAYVFKLLPPPAPGSVAISYMAQGEWQTVVDQGDGTLGGGPGGGTVMYATGDVSVTFDVIPDINTFVLVSWTDTTPYNNVCAAGPVSQVTEPPLFELEIAPGANVSGAEIEWPSGGGTASATVSAGGVISGDATGFASGSLGRIYIRPTAMPDAGSNFTIEYDSRPTVVENFSGVAVDGGGYATLNLADEPVPGSLTVRWVTAQTVSKTSGSDIAGTSAVTTSSYNDWSPMRTMIPGGYMVQMNHTTYTKVKTSETTNTMVTAHSITDDADGGFGGLPLLGSVNYAGKAVNLRLVSQAATTETWKSDQETVTAYSNTNAKIIARSGV